MSELEKIKQRVNDFKHYSKYYHDVTYLLNLLENSDTIIYGLRKENNTLKELNKSTTKSYFIYAEGDVIINANNDND